MYKIALIASSHLAARSSVPSPPQTDDEVHIQRTVVCWYITRYRGVQIEVRGQRAVEATVTPQAHIRPIKKVKELGKMSGMSRKV